MTEPLKIRPDPWYAVICGFPPSDYLGIRSLIGVANELAAPAFPHTRNMYLVIGWQRGLGTFQFYFRISDQDGTALLQSQPTAIAMELRGNELTMPYTVTVNGPGLYLVEGFLDDELTFRTTLEVTER